MIHTNIPPCPDAKGCLKYLAKPKVAKTDLVLGRDLPLLISHLHFNGTAFPLGSLGGGEGGEVTAGYGAAKSVTLVMGFEQLRKEKAECNSLEAASLGCNNSVSKRQTKVHHQEIHNGRYVPRQRGVRIAAVHLKDRNAEIKMEWKRASPRRAFCSVAALWWLANHVEGAACG